MRIAQVAPLHESVPPQFYGGTERVVSYLTEELVALGHQVTLFASGDSRTSAELCAPTPRALRLDTSSADFVAPHVLLVESVYRESSRFDVIHVHIDCLHFPLARRAECPTVTTLHGRLDLPGLAPLYREFHELPLVSISDAQREPLRSANWLATVPHGLPAALLPFRPQPGGYFAFLGRVSPEKGIDHAIEIARALGTPLQIAAKVGAADAPYFHDQIEPLLRDPLVTFLGEIGEEEKGELLGNARALLFPVSWPEPFGLVLIESLACGTPVVAYRAGSVPEIIDEGVTGFVVDDLRGAIRAAERVPELSRWRCRRTFEERFSVERMARAYVALYEQVAERSRARGA